MPGDTAEAARANQRSTAWGGAYLYVAHAGLREREDSFEFLHGLGESHVLQEQFQLLLHGVNYISGEVVCKSSCGPVC